MNLSHPKNLETLRGECDKLGTRIARLGFIRATLFILFVFTLASAFQTISSRDASGIVARIKELMEITKKTPDLDPFLGAIYFPKLNPEESKPSSESPDTSDAEAQPLSAAEEEVEIAKKKANAEKVEAAKKEQTELGAQLTKIANEAFTFAFKAPLLGTEIKLDLRAWGFILLLCFIFWEVHLLVQRHKLRTLQRIGGVMVARMPQEATIVDLLLFRSNGRRLAAFSRHPAQFELVASMIGGAALIVYLYIAGSGFWEGADPVSKRELIELYAFVIVYALAYGAFVKRQINSEAALVDGFEPVINYPSRVLALARSRLSAAAPRLWPEVNLVTGSAMVIGTLWLLVGAPTCSGPITGWDYLHNPEGWLVGPMAGVGAGGGWRNWHNILIATFYGSGLAIAGFTLPLLLFSLARRRRLGAGRIPLFLATATTVLALFFVSELTLGTSLDLLPHSFPCVLFWLTPIWIWWRYSRSKQSAAHADWPRTRRLFFYWYVPQVAISMIVSVGTLFEKHPLVGVPVFVCGLAALALGYWNARALAGANEPISENATLLPAQARAAPSPISSTEQSYPSAASQ